MKFGPGNERGDTLITVLAALAVGAIVVAGITTTMTHLHKLQGDLHFRMAIDAVINDVKIAFRGNPLNCLRNLPAALPAPGAKVAVTELNYVDADGNLTTNNPIVKTDPNGLIGSIEIATTAALSPTTYRVEYQLTFNLPPGTVEPRYQNPAVLVVTNAAGAPQSCVYADSGTGGFGLGSGTCGPYTDAYGGNAFSTIGTPILTNPSYPVGYATIGRCDSSMLGQVLYFCGLSEDGSTAQWISFADCAPTPDNSSGP